MRKTLIACVAVALLVGGGTATAARLVTGKDVRNGSLTGADLRNGSVRLNDLSDGTRSLIAGTGTAGTDGVAGPQGPKGDTGERGATGLTGPAGPAGADGRDGVDGADGEDGQDGADGADGAQGPPGPVLSTAGHLLFVDNGAQEIAHVTYELDEPVALNEIDNLTFIQRFQHNADAGANVILGVDADGDGSYEADDLAWHVGSSALDPSVLGDDTFLELDSPETTRVEPLTVTQWRSPSVAGDSSTPCGGTLATVAATCANVRFDATDKVHIVRFAIGGSATWTDFAILVNAPYIEGVAVDGGVVR